MARNQTPAPESKATPANEALIAQDMHAVNQMAVVERQRQELLAQSESEKAELMDLGRRLGQMEAASFFSNICDGVLLSSFENVKKSKAWKLLKNNEGQIFESFDDFCRQRLGYSYARLQQVSVNRNLIGQETFEQAERLGLRQVDYNAIKALPAPDQELVRRAVEEAQSRDEVLDLLQELAARHAKEKETLTQQVEEGKLEHAAVVKRLEVVTEQKEKAEARAARIAVMKPDEAFTELKTEATRVNSDALGAIRGGVRQVLVKLAEAPEGGEQSIFAASLIGELQAELNALREEFGLPDIANAAERELAAEVAQWSQS